MARTKQKEKKKNSAMRKTETGKLFFLGNSLPITFVQNAHNVFLKVTTERHFNLRHRKLGARNQSDVSVSEVLIPIPCWQIIKHNILNLIINQRYTIGDKFWLMERLTSSHDKEEEKK